MVIFSLFLFLIILFVGALGVDLMRFERERAKLQSTLDRAVLAAADIDQSLDPSFVVNEYFTKSGFPDSVTSVTVSEGLGFRSVSATARKQVSTHLLHMMGVDTLTAPAAGAAEERVDNVEISLVLDISGSMAFNNRITNLRSAGSEFVDAIFENAAENKVSLSIVPYNGQVNVGPDLIDKYNVTHRHNNTFCVDLPTSVYTTAALSRTLPMPQHVFADTYNGSNTSWSYDTTNMTPSTANRWCDPNAVNRIRVHSNNVTQLKNHINALQPVGATSIDAGMRYRQSSLNVKAAYTLSDMFSREVEPISSAYLDGARNLFTELARSDSDVKMRVTVVYYHAGDKKFYSDWSHQRGGVPVLSDADLISIKDRLPAVPDNERLILVETWADYSPPFNVGIKRQDLYNFVFTRPRFAPQVKFET